MLLENSCEEALREEEAGKPIAIGGTFFEPASKENDSLSKIFHPGT